LFRSFGASDFLELAIAALLAVLAIAWPRLAEPYRRLAAHPRWCMAGLGILPIALRLAMLPYYPAPAPAGADDFSYLLLADTLTHGRFANPVHPMHRFFEAVFVLQEPSYSSIYPAGQGIVLAAGQLIFGSPWAGVLLSVGAFCALCYWMLRGWVSAEWALAGGLLAVCEFGPLCQWMNLYWGGAVSAVAGCLIFGALARRAAWLLGIGLGIQLLTRPFEFVLVVLAIAIFRPRVRWHVLVPITAAIVISVVQNHQVTGSWTTLPYEASRYQYGVPATFTFQPNPTPHRALTAEQQLDYAAQSAIHGDGTGFMRRLGERIHFYRFFFLAPLYLALPFFAWKRYAWVAATIAILALGTNFYPYFYPHYIAVATCLFVLMSVVSLARIGALPARIILILCAAHFLFWYGRTQPDTDGRAPVNEQLARAGGKQLVFVRYAPSHMFHEWIHNGADIDRARVVWAADLGDAENGQLRRYYPDRTVWLVEPDAHPVRLTPLQ
jgi:hypothetical protein